VGKGLGRGRGRITINSSLPALQLYSPVYIYRTKEVGYHELSFFQSCFVAEKDVCEVQSRYFIYSISRR